jgi:hypothetical protein
MVPYLLNFYLFAHQGLEGLHAGNPVLADPRFELGHALLEFLDPLCDARRDGAEGLVVLGAQLAREGVDRGGRGRAALVLDGERAPPHGGVDPGGDEGRHEPTVAREPLLEGLVDGARHGRDSVRGGTLGARKARFHAGLELRNGTAHAGRHVPRELGTQRRDDVVRSFVAQLVTDYVGLGICVRREKRRRK